MHILGNNGSLKLVLSSLVASCFKVNSRHILCQSVSPQHNPLEVIFTIEAIVH